MFEQNGSAFADLTAKNLYKKKVLLNAGTNTLQISLKPLSNSLPEFFNSLISENLLLKVQDKNGRAFEQFNGVWMNSIGELKPGEIYTVIVNRDIEFEYEGTISN